MTPNELRALAEALDRLKFRCDGIDDACLVEDAADYLRACADAEPVTWIAHNLTTGHVKWTTDRCRARGWTRSVNLRVKPLYAHPAPAVPAGWKLVPVEPTPEMLGAGSYAVDLHSHSPIGVYAAMLAAAPVPPQREPAHDIPLFDFDAEAWKQVLAAARDSKWMPAEYAMNDWLADICQWLRDGPPAGEQAEPKREPLTYEQLVSACYTYRHDFGLLDPDEQHLVIEEAGRWAKAFGIGGRDE